MYILLCPLSTSSLYGNVGLGSALRGWMKDLFLRDVLGLGNYSILQMDIIASPCGVLSKQRSGDPDGVGLT
jgi:hypothetical protein